MSAPADSGTRTFRDLRSRLARRRLSQLEPRLRIELLALALLLGGFVYWQVRVPLAGVAYAAGPGAVLVTLVLAWLVLAILTLGLVAFRHHRRLSVAPPGPAWLALPVEPVQLSAHLAWDSSAVALWMSVPALGLLASAAGLFPLMWLLALIAPFAWVLVLAARVGAALGERLALRGLPPGPGRSAIERALSVAASRRADRPLPPARWTRSTAWGALCAKDIRITGRVPSLARSLLSALLLWGLSLLAWRVPPLAGERLDYFAAFVLALVGSASFGEWLVGLSGSDPFATVRSLPLGLSSVWGARFAWAVLGALALLSGHALLARGLSPHALRLFLIWVGAATLAIAALAVNYGVTLFPRADLARRMLWLSLGLAVAASLMIPLMGWIVLLSAILHSARRLARWSRLEEI